MSPARIQRRRTAGWRVSDHTTSPRGAAYVGRPTRFGNPFQVARVGKVWIVFVDAAPGVTGRTIATVFSEREARQNAVDNFRVMLRTPGGSEQAELFRALLHGRDLTCWCPLDMPCHADVLLKLANQGVAW